MTHEAAIRRLHELQGEDLSRNHSAERHAGKTLGELWQRLGHERHKAVSSFADDDERTVAIQDILEDNAERIVDWCEHGVGPSRGSVDERTGHLACRGTSRQSAYGVKADGSVWATNDVVVVLTSKPSARPGVRSEWGVITAYGDLDGEHATRACDIGTLQRLCDTERSRRQTQVPRRSALTGDVSWSDAFPVGLYAMYRRQQEAQAETRLDGDARRAARLRAREAARAERGVTHRDAQPSFADAPDDSPSGVPDLASLRDRRTTRARQRPDSNVMASLKAARAHVADAERACRGKEGTRRPKVIKAVTASVASSLGKATDALYDALGEEPGGDVEDRVTQAIGACEAATPDLARLVDAPDAPAATRSLMPRVVDAVRGVASDVDTALAAQREAEDGCRTPGPLADTTRMTRTPAMAGVGLRGV